LWLVCHICSSVFFPLNSTFQLAFAPSFCSLFTAAQHYKLTETGFVAFEDSGTSDCDGGAMHDDGDGGGQQKETKSNDLAQSLLTNSPSVVKGKKKKVKLTAAGAAAQRAVALKKWDTLHSDALYTDSAERSKLNEGGVGIRAPRRDSVTAPPLSITIERRQRTHMVYTSVFGDKSDE
jgi:hypothetical protein